MSVSTNQPSPQELLAGIEAVAAYVGPDCAGHARSEMRDAAAHAEARETSSAADASVLRDHFATAALTAIVGAERTMESLSRAKKADRLVLAGTIARAVYEIADAMLVARGAA